MVSPKIESIEIRCVRKTAVGHLTSECLMRLLTRYSCSSGKLKVASRDTLSRGLVNLG